MGRRRRLVAGLLAVLLVATACEPVRYVFDDAGQLKGVIDPGGETAVYRYDDVGNIVGVDTYGSDEVSVVGVTPLRGVPGDEVVIQGTGFDGEEATENNTVAFGDVPAEVASGGKHELKVVVPEGASTGPVTVTASEGEATSDDDFVVEVDRSPVVTGFSPQVVGSGDTVTVEGENFVEDPLLNGVLLSGTYGTVEAATGSELSVAVPPVPASGPVVVATPEGTAEASGDLFVAPAPYEAADVGFTGRAEFGEAGVVEIDEAGKVGLLIFDGEAGQRVSVRLRNSLGGDGFGFCNLEMRLLGPAGTELGKKGCIQAGGFIGPVVLPADGTYTVLFDPHGATGAADVTVHDVPDDVAGEIQIDGEPVRVDIEAPGQQAMLSFDGTAGETVVLSMPDSTPGALCLRNGVRLLGPDGGQVARMGCTADNRIVGPLDLPADGTYTVTFAPPTQTWTGFVTLALHSQVPDVEGEIEVGGEPVRVDIDVPAQKGYLSFEGEAGQRVSATMPSSTSSLRCLRSWVSLLDADGEELGRMTCSSGSPGNLLGPVELPAAGTYRLAFEPETTDWTGFVTLALHEPEDVVGEIEVGGDPVPVAIEVPGQQGFLTFDGVAGQEVSVTTPTSSGPVGICVHNWIRLRGPDGEQLERMACPARVIGPLELPEDGTYTVAVEPTRGDWEASFTIAVHDGPPPEGQSQTEEVPLPAAPVELAPAAEDPVTTVSGLVRDTGDEPLAGVSVSIEGHEAQTDSAGEFALELPGDVAPGQHELVVDGNTAGSDGASYGTFVMGVEVTAQEESELDHPVWLPTLDTANTVSLEYPLVEDVVVTTPEIPGLEVHIPAGAEITDADGELVTEVGITDVPVDKPPFPLPQDTKPPVYFTIQPGGAVVDSAEGVRVVYPNEADEPPGTWMSLLGYSPIDGWFLHGSGEVTGDGAQVAPDDGVTLDRFTATAMSSAGFTAPPDGPSVGNGNAPVDLATGRWVHEATDLAVEDVVPVSLDRVYRPDDPVVRAFGRGAALGFDMYLRVGAPFQDAQLILPDGVRLDFERTSEGEWLYDAVFEHSSTPTEFHSSEISWNGNGWDLVFKDGTTMVFALDGHLQAVRDRLGNQVSLQHEGGRVTSVQSPAGRWIGLAYDDAGRVSEARDNIGRTVTYAYDDQDRLAEVTDPAGETTGYGYDDADRLATITGPEDVVLLSTSYDDAGRVTTQTGPDGDTVSYDYEVDADGAVVEAEVTDPADVVRQVNFTDGYWMTDTVAAGTDDEQTVTVERDPATHLVTAEVDHAGRRTAYGYDAYANQTSVTALDGTDDAVTFSSTYEPGFHQVASESDPLGRTVSYEYDADGKLSAEVDPAGGRTSYSYDDYGRVVAVTDPRGQTTETSYEALHRVEVTDPAGYVTSTFLDGAGREAVLTDPLGNQATLAYDVLGRVTGATDPTGASTALTYDAFGNTTGITDAEGNTTSWAYDVLSRPVERTDPTGESEAFVYDTAGNLAEHTDRRGVVTGYDYDVLGRSTQVQFGVDGADTESTISYGYDEVGRLAEVDDSAYGVASFAYDAFDRLTTETTPEGEVTYDYNSAGQQTSVGVGQASSGGRQGLSSETVYGYDDAGRLESVTQDGSVASVTRDEGGQVTAAALPNGVSAAYEYDERGLVTSITYDSDADPEEDLGGISYGYDPLGRRVTASGSLIDTVAPDPVTSTAHDAANRLVERNGTDLVYDAAGNLIDDGTRTYTWDARGQLASIDGADAASFGYDAFGRRTETDINGETTGFLYDGANIAAEQGPDGAAGYMSGLGMDEVLARTTDLGDVTSYLADGSGSTVGLVDETGEVATSYGYSPFGVTEATGDADSNPFAYTGRELDETGLYYYRARYYDAELGRFISEDPIGFEGGDPNLYGYVGNDPVNRTDPTGLCYSMNGVVFELGAEALSTVAMTRPAAAALRGGDIGYGEFRAVTSMIADDVQVLGGMAMVACMIGLGIGAANPGAVACTVNSFTPGTEVLLADGTSVPIEDVEEGDLVAATDPATGETEARPVIDLIEAHGSKDLVDIGIDGETITATDGHPFWVDDQGGWVDAGDLQEGDQLLATEGTTTEVDEVAAYTDTRTVHNLTVDGIHTYHVAAGDTDALTHNCSRKLLHGEDMLRQTDSYSYWSRQSDRSIIESLRPPADESLVVNQHGTIMDGNTRALILLERGVDIDALPAASWRSGL